MAGYSLLRSVESLVLVVSCSLSWASSEPHSGSFYSVGFLMAEWLGFKSSYPKKNMGEIHDLKTYPRGWGRLSW